MHFVEGVFGLLQRAVKVRSELKLSQGLHRPAVILATIQSKFFCVNFFAKLIWNV
jgi:hypothetical protein